MNPVGKEGFGHPGGTMEQEKEEVSTEGTQRQESYEEPDYCRAIKQQSGKDKMQELVFRFKQVRSLRKILNSVLDLTGS